MLNRDGSRRVAKTTLRGRWDGCDACTQEEGPAVVLGEHADGDAGVTACPTCIVEAAKLLGLVLVPAAEPPQADGGST